MGKRLSKYYYKEHDTRFEGMDSHGWWFTGAGSFMSNGYVIYTDGLDGYEPNPNAILQGFTYNERLFDTRSMDQRSSYYQFTSQLSQIADKAAAAERQYLKLKMDQLKQQTKENGIQDNYLAAIETAIQQEDYSAAYTLLLKRDKDLAEFKREINSNYNHSFAKTNEFFHSHFFYFLQQKFTEQLNNQSGSHREVSLDTNFEDFVDEYLNDALHISVQSNESIAALRQDLIDGLQDLADNSGGMIKFSVDLTSRKGYLKYAEDSVRKGSGHLYAAQKIGANGKKYHGLLTTEGEYRCPNEMARAFAMAIANTVGKGISGEIYSISSLENIGTRAFSGGKITTDWTNAFTGKHAVVKQTNDTYAYEIFNSVIPIDKIISDVYKAGYDDQTQEFHQEIQKRMQDIALTDAAGQFFEIAVNVKTYLSNNPLEIKGSGSFGARLTSLENINGLIDGNMVNKLIFMLNNTAEGAIMSDRISEIQDYFASVCVAWMWDHPEEMFDLNLSIPTNYYKIRLFNSGGAYFTASQIIKQTLGRLMGLNENEFVQVTINPPPQYNNWWEKLSNEPLDGITTKDQWNNMLKKYWDEAKADALSKGTMAIHFDQTRLNDLLGNLTSILNNS